MSSVDKAVRIVLSLKKWRERGGLKQVTQWKEGGQWCREGDNKVKIELFWSRKKVKVSQSKNVIWSMNPMSQCKHSTDDNKRINNYLEEWRSNGRPANTNTKKGKRKNSDSNKACGTRYKKGESTGDNVYNEQMFKNTAFDQTFEWFI